MAFGLCTGATASLDAPIGKLNGGFGWWTDGSLRAHGEILMPTAVRVLVGLLIDYANVCSIRWVEVVVIVGLFFVDGPAPLDPLETPLSAVGVLFCSASHNY